MNVDTTKAITHVSLCAGYGGIDLGLKRAIPSLRTIAFSEIEAFACANLVAKMEAGLLDPAPLWTDLKTFPWADFHGCVDILSGGYPCQPFSAAGKRLGAEDPRHLWPHISAGIAAMRPSCCFFENVEGHISLGLPDVIEDLAGLGYRTTWGIFSASEVGAPHQRKRVFILAYDQSLGIQGCWPSWLQEPRPHVGQALPVRGGDAGGSELADSAVRRCDGQHAGSGRDVGEWSAPQDVRPEAAHAGSCGTAQAWPSRPGEQQHWWEPARVLVDDTTHTNRRSRVSAEEAATGPDDIWWRRSGESSERETQPSLGRCVARQRDGLVLPGLSGISHKELAEIREWMHRSSNRTDELRLLGNAVVSQTAERAFRTLIGELMEHANQ